MINDLYASFTPPISAQNKTKFDKKDYIVFYVIDMIRLLFDQ